MTSPPHSPLPPPRLSQLQPRNNNQFVRNNKFWIQSIQPSPIDLKRIANTALNVINLLLCGFILPFFSLHPRMDQCSTNRRSGDNTMLDTETVFERYQAVRSRMPQAATGSSSVGIASLLDITSQVEAFVFDAFGVLNVGETLIEGADHRLDELRQRGCHIRILTNAASLDRARTIAKFHRLGLRVEDDEIISSRDATLQHLDARHWGVIAADGDRLSDIAFTTTRLGDTAEDYRLVEGFLFLSSEGWNDQRQKLLMAAMDEKPRPLVIANADLVAPRGTGFSLEPGHFGHLVADRHPDHVRFFGKPFPEVFQLVEKTLPGIAPAKIAMCGDTLHTDIMGAAARGWRTVLVTRDGLFAGLDTQGFSERARLFADWHLERI